MAHNLVDGSEPNVIALDISGDGVFDGEDQIDGANVGGVKTDSLFWQPTLVKSGPGSLGTLLIPTDGKGEDEEGAPPLETPSVQGDETRFRRSSWGILRFED
jgi:hypothetical protein